MRGTLLAALIVLGTGAPVAGTDTDTWTTAVKRGDFAAAATLLQRAVFEHPGTQAPDPAAVKQLALLYGEGKGVERDPVLACGLLRAHAIATAGRPRGTVAARKAATDLVERFCAPLPPAQRAAAFAAMSCPRIGLQRGSIMALEPGWSIQFNDRSATITRYGETREQPLAGDLLCRAQVMRVRHTPLSTPTGSADALRHMIEFVTVQSSWHSGSVNREIVWQLYEVRGLELDLAAVQRWQEPGSAWPAPPLPDTLAGGAAFKVHGADIEYEIPDDPPRRGTVAQRRARR
jgi:hypothetical protein